jgi:predicted cupin superfamily sugar epimerase
MQPAAYWIDHLGLKPHPEGGFYKETYRAAENITGAALPGRFSGARSFSTAIYFLLRSQDKSLFHRIKSDELWHFHAGSTLAIYVLSETGLMIHKLGSRVDEGDALQVAVPANTWFGAKVIDSNAYTLAGCTVAPGFDFQDFEMATTSRLLSDFPNHHEIIKQLTPA